LKEQAVEAARAAETRAQIAEVRLEPLLQEVDALRRSVEDERRGHYEAHKQVRTLMEHRGASSVTSTTDYTDTEHSRTSAVGASSTSFSASSTFSASASMSPPQQAAQQAPQAPATPATTSSVQSVQELARLRGVNGALEHKLTQLVAELDTARSSLAVRAGRIEALEKAKEAAEAGEAKSHEVHASLIDAQQAMEAKLAAIRAKEGSRRAEAELATERMEAQREEERVAQHVAQMERDLRLAEEGRKEAERQLESSRTAARDSLNNSRRLEAEASAAKADVVMLEEAAAASASAGGGSAAGMVMMERARLAERRWEQAEARCRQAEAEVEAMRRRESSPENQEVDGSREGSPTTMGTPMIQAMVASPLQPSPMPKGVSFATSPVANAPMGLGMEVERLRERLSELEDEGRHLRQAYQEAADEESKQRRRAEGAVVLRDEAERSEKAMRTQSTAALGETRRAVMRLCEIW
jgi:chromosome segregation ATPase